MADLSDVENALVAIIATALFPGTSYLAGSTLPSLALAVPIPTPITPSPTIGPISTKLYRGWPESAALEADLTQSRAHVSVFSDPGMTRNVSRWQQAETLVVTANVPTIIGTISAPTQVTLSGAITAGNVVGITFGTPLAGYAYAIQANDTLTTAAAGLAAKIPGATSSGAVIDVLPGALYGVAIYGVSTYASYPAYLSVGTMVPQTALTIVRQQEQGIRISIWAPTPQARDAICGLIDNALAGLRNAAGRLTRFFQVGAYEAARLAYRTSYTNDMPARDRVWRRDLCYTVEYATTLLEQDPAVLFAGGAVWAQGALSQWGVLEPSNSVTASTDGASIYIDALGNIVGAQPIS